MSADRASTREPREESSVDAEESASRSDAERDEVASTDRSDASADRSGASADRPDAGASRSTSSHASEPSNVATRTERSASSDAPRATAAEPAPSLAPPAPVPAAILDVARGPIAPNTATSSDVAATPSVEADGSAVAGSTHAPKSSSAADLALPSGLASPDSPADPASLATTIEHDLVSGHARSATSGAPESSLAIAARASSRPADVASIAPREPAAPPRLTPAELPQFLETLQVRVDGNEGFAFVELEPLELGRLTVELSLRPEGGVRADVRAERGTGYAAVEARIPELRASLVERGFASADVQVSLGLAQRDARQDPGTSNPRRARRDASRDLETQRVLALAPSRNGSIDLWA